MSGYVLHNSLLHLLLKNSDFLNTDISQGSVATRLGCGGVFTYDIVTNFLLSLTVKEFWKSVNICWSYGQELGVLFFLTHGVDWKQTADRTRPILLFVFANAVEKYCNKYTIHSTDFYFLLSLKLKWKCMLIMLVKSL